MKLFLLTALCCLLLVACDQSANVPATNAVPPVETGTTQASMPQAAAEAAATDSAYTELDPNKCKKRTPEPDSGAIIQAECPGVGGYKVITSASDHSQVISLIDPKGKETLLPFRDVLGTASDFILGDKLEWRVQGKGTDAKPTSIIVRVTKFIDPADKDKTESLLAVARLTGDGPCFTDLVRPSAYQNVSARQSADARDRPCMPRK